jgi:hypothetical protein
MNTDKVTKSLLAAIAVALWVIAMNPWLRPMPVAAQERVDLGRVESSLDAIQSDISSMETALGRISKGTCVNSKVC